MELDRRRFLGGTAAFALIFLEPQRAPLLVVYRKHALTSIRVLDLIPRDQTWVEKK